MFASLLDSISGRIATASAKGDSSGRERIVSAVGIVLEARRAGRAFMMVLGFLLGLFEGTNVGLSDLLAAAKTVIDFLLVLDLIAVHGKEVAHLQILKIMGCLIILKKYAADQLQTHLYSLANSNRLISRALVVPSVLDVG